MQDVTDDITGWIQAWQDGDAAARDRVFTRLYAELKRIAAGLLKQGDGHATLQPTALLNDALLKLTWSAQVPDAQDRSHFARIVARAMRQVLVDRARRRLADKRGAGATVLSLSEPALDVAMEAASPAELVALDDALATLARLDPRAASVVELRVFAGLTIEETAQAMALHPSAVNREWAHASSWLKQQLVAAG